MNEGLIARRYATAMLKFAQERNAAAIVYRKMKLLEQNYITHPDLHKALLSPVLSAKDKELLLSTAVNIKPDGAYIGGIRLLIRNHREMYARPICLMYQKLYREAYHIDEVRITTATEVNKEVIARIRKVAETRSSNRMEVMHVIDPSIIGGFILKINSVEMDASIRKELKELRMQFDENAMYE